MQFLLVAINAKYIHSNPAVYSLRAYVGKELGQYVGLAEYTINQPLQEILSDLYLRKPDVIGFSCYIWNWRYVQELIGELPKILPGVPLWLGGPEVSYDAGKILGQYPQLAGIMSGEGEAVFRELLQFYADDREEPAGGGESIAASPQVCSGYKEPIARKRLGEIKGLVLPTGATPPQAPLDMDDIPFLYQDLEPFENKIIYYESSRGCPFCCSYCLSAIDKNIRFRDMETVKKELGYFLDHKVKQVKFLDRTFNCSHSHAMEIWRYIQKHDNGVTNFHFEISAHLLTEEEIALLNSFRPGLAQLEIGVQSTNPLTLRAINRTTNLEKLRQAVAAIRGGNHVHQHLDLIAGLPFENYESFRHSFNDVYRMGPQQLQLGFLKVLKGSPMWEQAAEYGISYTEQPPYEVLRTKWLSYGEILNLKRVEEMVELYYNSAQFTHTLPFLEQVFPDPFSLYEALADFYRRNGYEKSNPSRVYRYHILLAFAIEYDREREAAYRELLTFDLYLREKVKSRPEFSADLFPYREAIRRFYQKEEKERRELPDYTGYDWKQLMKMTHLEPFSYPVWDGEKMGQKSGEPRFVLFDYRKRNPLNGEAQARLVE